MLLDRIVAEDNPIQKVSYIDVRQSMKNGGGPACLRLRVVLTATEIALSHQGMYVTDDLLEELKTWGAKHYRDELKLDDLADPKLPDEVRSALDSLTQILKIGSIYPFQKTACP